MLIYLQECSPIPFYPKRDFLNPVVKKSDQILKRLKKRASAIGQSQNRLYRSYLESNGDAIPTLTVTGSSGSYFPLGLTQARTEQRVLSWHTNPDKIKITVATFKYANEALSMEPKITSFSNTYRLLLHGFVNSNAIRFSNRVKFVNATNPSIGHNLSNKRYFILGDEVEVQ